MIRALNLLGILVCAFAVTTGNVSESDDMNEFVFLGAAVFFFLLTLAAYAYGRFVKKDGANHGLLITAYLNVLDVCTDMMYAIQLSRDYGVLKPWILAGFLFSIISNAVMSLAYMMVFLQNELKQDAFTVWFGENKSGATVVCFLGVFSVDLLNMLDSKLFGFDFLSAPLSLESKAQLLYAGAFGLLLEDLPQLGIQIYIYAATQPQLASIYSISTLVTVLSCLFTSIRYATGFLLAGAQKGSEGGANIEMQSPSDDGTEEKLQAAVEGFKRSRKIQQQKLFALGGSLVMIGVLLLTLLALNTPEVIEGSDLANGDVECKSGSILIGKKRCDPCNRGKFALKGDQSCTPCPSGKFSEAVGASSNVTCLDCDSGRFSELSSTTCLDCDAGTYSPNSSSTCTPCTGGKASAFPNVACSECEAGRKSEKSMQSSNCVDCPAGRYAATEGSSSCALCAVGKFSKIFNATSCQECESGKYSSGGDSACYTCGGGTVQRKTVINGERKNFCALCDPGEYARAGDRRCSDCPIGSYSRNESSASCQKCEGGKYNTVAGSSSCAECTAIVSCSQEQVMC